MTIRRMLTTAMLLASTAMTAQAAEVTLYENPGFGGRELTLQGFTPDISSTGFNDRASSIAVRSGTWEVCTDANFKGYCATLAPGDYQALDPRFNNRISSAREAGTTAVEITRLRREQRGAMELFGQAGFRGRALQLDRDTPDLSGTGFDDRARSVVVTEGTWKLCTGAGFSGTCSTFEPGRYANLGSGMARQVSSARMITAREEPRAQRGRRGGEAVELFEDPRFGGERFGTQRDVRNLDARGFNDKASSMIIRQGKWEMCVDGDFNGRCVAFGPGRYADLRGLNGEISSLRRVN